MKRHVWRPLYVVIALVVCILLLRTVYVPQDFAAQERGYTFGYHRLGNEQEWREYPAKYSSTPPCNECHADKVGLLSRTQHAGIPCENCHGPVLEHPQDPQRLEIDGSRALCIRCHARLYMPSSGRQAIPGVDPQQHHTDNECSDCHNPHNPSLEEM